VAIVHLLRAALEEDYRMNSVETYQKRLRDEVSAVEKEIQSRNEQIDQLNKRLEGLKRAVELFESEEPAIAELLRTSISDGNSVFREMAPEPTAMAKNAFSSRKQSPPQSQASRLAHNGRAKTKTIRTPSGARKTSKTDGLKRGDMIAAVLKRHSRLSVSDLIAALDREFGWKCTESNLTGHLYTNPKFAHTKADRSADRPVTWSLK
jgi:predicted RNase H-like nuclease (RuvC/YqgF family)